ncbi:MAG TPA: hypothetical protein VFC19_29710 [Candidatus Limnocylindrales bacterium]|nr:hypothetical protein [Candidatus Limnocylindrales bacterium]
MTEPVTLHNSYYLIDTKAWLDLRTGAHHAEHSSQLQDFVRCNVFDDYRPTMDTTARMQLWCAAHGFPVGDGATIVHDNPCLTKPITIVLTTIAASAGLPGQVLTLAVALVSIDGAAPEVYSDITTDEGYWLDVTTVEFTCPAGHRWSWDGTGQPLWFLDRVDGPVPVPTTLHAMFGDLPHAPFARCRECAAFDDGRTPTMCPCSGTAIYCPICQQRSQVSLPEIPTHEEANR